MADQQNPQPVQSRPVKPAKGAKRPAGPNDRIETCPEPAPMGWMDDMSEQQSPQPVQQSRPIIPARGAKRPAGPNDRVETCPEPAPMGWMDDMAEQQSPQPVQQSRPIVPATGAKCPAGPNASAGTSPEPPTMNVPQPPPNPVAFPPARSFNNASTIMPQYAAVPQPPPKPPAFPPARSFNNASTLLPQHATVPRLNAGEDQARGLFNQAVPRAPQPQPIADPQPSGPKAGLPPNQPLVPPTPPLPPAQSGGQMSKGEADSIARYRKQEQDFEAVKADYHNKIAERDETNEGLKGELEKLKGEVKRLTGANNQLHKDATSASDATKQAEDELKKAQEELRRQKSWADFNSGDLNRLEKDVTAKQNELTEKKKEVVKMQGKIQSLTTGTAQSNAEVEQLKTENTALKEANAAMQNDATALNQEYEEVCKDFGESMTLREYLHKTRELHTGGRLRHQDSHTSLEQELSAREGRDDLRQVSGATLLEQMQAAEDRSSHGDGEDESDDGIEYEDDPTLNRLGLGKKMGFADYLDIMTEDGLKITELEQTVADLTQSQAALLEKIAEHDATPPPAPVIQLVKTTEMMYSPSGLSNMWWNAPLWLRFAILMMVCWYFYLVVCIVGERHTWLAANDLSRERVVRLGMGTGSIMFAPLLFGLENWLGMDSALLG